jgi:hypothetical protein
MGADGPPPVVVSGASKLGLLAGSSVNYSATTGTTLMRFSITSPEFLAGLPLSPPLPR